MENSPERFEQEGEEKRRQAEANPTAGEAELLPRELRERPEVNRQQSPDLPRPTGSGMERLISRVDLLFIMVGFLGLILIGGLWWANSGDKKEPSGEIANGIQKPLPPGFTNSIGMKFVRIPRGTFWMGGGSQGPPTKQVDIPQDFYLGVYTVTQREWQSLMGNNPSYFRRDGPGKGALSRISDSYLKLFPVETVSWKDAKDFIAKLNEKELNSGWVYRLPKEAEWE